MIDVNHPNFKFPVVLTKAEAEQLMTVLDQHVKAVGARGAELPAKFFGMIHEAWKVAAQAAATANEAEARAVAQAAEMARLEEANRLDAEAREAADLGRQ